jgi:ATP-dependent NAD(P)H-hydrate dehydratase
MISHAKMALNLAKENGMYVVLDADALWMLGQDLGILKGYRRAVITPNVMEFKRLSEAVVRRPLSPLSAKPASSLPLICAIGH